MKYIYQTIITLILIIFVFNCTPSNIPKDCRLKNMATLIVDTKIKIPQNYGVGIPIELHNSIRGIDTQNSQNNDGFLFGILDNSPAIFQIKNITQDTPFVLVGTANLRTGLQTGTAKDYMFEYQGLSILLRPSDVCSEKKMTINFGDGSSNKITFKCAADFSSAAWSCLDGIITSTNGAIQFKMPKLVSGVVTTSAVPPATQVCETRYSEVCTPIYIGNKRNDSCWFTWPWGVEDCFAACHDRNICYIPDFRVDCQNIPYTYCYDVYTY